MAYFFQQVLDGLGTGAIYAVLALALVQIFRSTSIVNFAQGEMGTFFAFVALQLTLWKVPLYLAIVIAVLLSIVAGMLIERIVVRRVESKEHLTVVIVTLGLFMIVNSISGFIWSYSVRAFPDPLPTGTFTVGGVVVSIRALILLGILAVVSLLLYVLFQRTGLGLQMRAAISNPDSASLLGVHVGRMHMIGWGLAAALGTLAAVLAAPKLFLEPNMMLSVLTYAFCALVLGGVDSSLGAVIGGLVIGLSESLAGMYLKDTLGNDLKILIPLGIVFVTLLLRPSGLFGKVQVNRV